MREAGKETPVVILSDAESIEIAEDVCTKNCF
jgi:hypothetical protein